MPHMLPSCTRNTDQGEDEMATRNASAEWKGNLMEGDGKMALGSGAFEGPYSFKSRFEEGQGTNPEELIGAAEAGCFTMQLSHALSEDGHAPGGSDPGQGPHPQRRRQPDDLPDRPRDARPRARRRRGDLQGDGNAKTKEPASSRARSGRGQDHRRRGARVLIHELLAGRSRRSARRQPRYQPQDEADREQPAQVREHHRVVEQLRTISPAGSNAPSTGRPSTRGSARDRLGRAAARAPRRSRRRRRPAGAARSCRPGLQVADHDQHERPWRR